MAAKTKRELPLNQRRHIDDFTADQLESARQTIRLHLDDKKYQNTITFPEIYQYAEILDRHPSIISTIVRDEEGEIVTLYQRSMMPNKFAELNKAQLVGA